MLDSIQLSFSSEDENIRETRILGLKIQGKGKPTKQNNKIVAPVILGSESYAKDRER